jgi:hypothetical protein
MALSTRLRGREPYLLLRVQLEDLGVIGAPLGDPRHRDAAWTWLVAHADALLDRFREPFMRAHVLELAGVLCDASYVSAIDRFVDRLTPIVEGGPRSAATTCERVRLCVAQRAALTPSLRAFFLEAPRAR